MNFKPGTLSMRMSKSLSSLRFPFVNESKISIYLRNEKRSFNSGRFFYAVPG